MNYPKADAIILAVAFATGISFGAIKSRDKFRSIARARRIAMAAVRRRLAMSYPEIGMVFGRDHTTVMYAVKCVIGCEHESALLDSILETMA